MSAKMLKKLEDMRSAPSVPVSPAAALQAERRRLLKQQQEAQLSISSSSIAASAASIYACACGEIFRTHTALAQHELKHNKGAGPIRCPDCAAMFDNKASMEQHSAQKHQQVARKDTSEAVADSDTGYFSAGDWYELLNSETAQATLEQPGTVLTYPGIDSDDNYILKPVGAIGSAGTAANEKYQALPVLQCASQFMLTSQGLPVTVGNATDCTDDDILTSTEKCAALSAPVWNSGAKWMITADSSTPSSGPLPVEVITPAEKRRDENRQLAVAIALELEVMLERRDRQKQAAKAERKLLAEKAMQKQTPK